MTSKLRDDIRKYEEENNTRFTCGLLPIRCLDCPISRLGCPAAKKRLS
jgi:hypothetical protein